ncbi:MAG: hypothetical protein ACKO34_05010 [Vampirovibrionales bacterium]
MALSLYTSTPFREPALLACSSAEAVKSVYQPPITSPSLRQGNMSFFVGSKESVATVLAEEQRKAGDADVLTFTASMLPSDTNWQLVEPSSLLERQLMKHIHLDDQTTTRVQPNHALFLYPLRSSKANSFSATSDSCLGVSLTHGDVERVLTEERLHQDIDLPVLLSSPLLLTHASIQTALHHGEMTTENTPIQFVDLDHAKSALFSTTTGKSLNTLA